MAEEKTDIQNYASRWCERKAIHVAHVWSVKEDLGQQYPYYCHGTWETFKEE